MIKVKAPSRDRRAYQSTSLPQYRKHVVDGSLAAGAVYGLCLFSASPVVLSSAAALKDRKVFTL